MSSAPVTAGKVDPVQGSGFSGEMANASLADWLAVTAGTIGALMAALDVSIVNAALPTIQGGIGASGTEGTWVSTSFLVSEIVMIPLTGWFERTLTLRTFLLLMTVFFALFSALCGFSTTLPMMIIGRTGQGFTGGAMIPTALTIVSTRLPPHQRPIGVALFGMTVVLGPVLGPIAGGWLTETLSWHYAFFVNLPIAGGLLLLLLFGLKSEKADLAGLLKADWLGIIGMTLFLGCLTVVLEEGQRDSWFDSEFIRALSVITLLGLVLLLIGQVTARKPVIDLSIILRRSFGGVFLMSLATGAGLFGTLFVIPQFLAAIPGYNALQAGQVAMVSGIPTLLMLPFFPLMVRVIDARIAIALGLLLFGGGCYLDAFLVPQSAGINFMLSQILRGFGQGFALLFLNQSATISVPEHQAGDASGLFNAARNLGGSMGLALISTLQDRRGSFHFERITETIQANSVDVQQYLQELTHGSSIGLPTALRQVFMQIRLQAAVMTFNDIFFVLAFILFCTIPLVLLLKLPRGAGGMSLH